MTSPSLSHSSASRSTSVPFGRRTHRFKSPGRYEADVCLGCVLAQGAHQEIAPGQELLAQVAPVRAPPRVGDDIEGRGLEQAADVHRLGTSLGQYALAGRDSGPLDQERPVRAYVEDLSVQRSGHCVPVGLA
jgi:hypothetical protein